MRYIGIGIIFWMFAASVGIFIGYWQMFAIVGFGAWVLGAVFSGALLSGDRIRANFATETDEDRKYRLDWSWRFFLIGLPSAATAIFLYVNGFGS